MALTQNSTVYISLKEIRAFALTFRLRMDAVDTTDSLDSFTTVENLWFEDADVVFCAGKSKFRVYRGLLSSQSKIFRDMFCIPQGPAEDEVGDDSETQDGPFTVITLPDDENDVRRFFLAIFDASVYGPPPLKYSLDVTVSIMRLAHKYEVPFLMLRAVAHLDSFFPLDKQALLKGARQLRNDTNQENDTNRRLESFLDTIPLAVITDVQWILPGLLYLLVLQHTISDIITHPSFTSLASHFRVLIIRFRIQYALERDNRFASVWMLPSENCLTKEQCRYVSKILQTNDQARVTESQYASVVFSVAVGPNGWSLCKSCQVAATKHQKELLELYWNQFPIVCGFKSWEVLKEMRNNWANTKKVGSDTTRENVWSTF